jgi:hypothetical protein
MSNILKEITKASTNKEVTFDQVVQAFNAGINTSIVKPSNNSFKANSIFGFVGVLLLFIGLGIYVSSFWGDLNTSVQLLLSLGLGLAWFYLSIAVSYKYPHTFYSTLLIIASELWLVWGLVFAVDKLNLATEVKVFNFATLLLILAWVNKYLFGTTSKSMYYLGFSASSMLAFLFYISYYIRNSSDYLISIKAYTLGLTLASISGLIYLYHNRYAINEWYRGLSLFGLFTLFTSNAFGFLVAIGNDSNRYYKFPEGNSIPEILFGLVFMMWYWVAIIIQSRILIIFNSLYLYFWIMYIYFRYFNGYSFGLTVALSGLFFIAVSGLTYVLTNRLGKNKQN